MSDPFGASAFDSPIIPPRWDAAASSSAPTSAPSAARPVTVTELTRKIKRLLETQITDILVEGEISGYKAASSGHLYFDLKDSGALIHCVMWASDAARLTFRPDNGAKVELRGKLTVYDQRGQYQLTATKMRPAGLGKLYQAFLEMKERLASEGLFDPALKKPLPPHPNCIGIVTSPTGAAIQDMLNILTRRAPHIHVYIWPARVQGEGAAKEIAHAIRRFNEFTQPVDVLIVGRGGGSLEDLWAFNEEVVARAIFESRLPVISAVGHETDTTIADYVADLRAPTPSAAAELVARDSSEILRHLSILQGRAVSALREQTSFLRQAPHLALRLEGAVLPRVSHFRGQLREIERSYGMQLPPQRVNQGKQHYDTILEQMRRGIRERLRDRKNSHNQFESQLRHLNPKAILKRGYSITYNADSGHIIQKQADAPAGTPLNIILGEGEIAARVNGASDSGSTTPAQTRSRTTRARKKNPTLEWFGAPEESTES
jgi:exodeoxyribonuclease VII large subunit